jgi:bla regulator protein blaR1
VHCSTAWSANVVADLLQSLQPAVLALGWTLIHALWQAALVAALYAVSRQVLRGARARVALGHLALLALTVLPLLTFLDRIAAPAGNAALSGSDVFVLSALAAAEQGGRSFEAWLPWLVVGWSGGVALLCLRQIIQWRELHRLCRRAVPLDAEWQGRFDALKRRVGVRFRVGLRQSADVALPMLVGILRPTILLPASLMLRLPVDRIELILLHELAHLRRLDPLFNLLQTIVETLLFYHPAVHWMSRRLREDRELCCDEIVLANGADPMRYARVLLALAETQSAPAPVLALAASGGALMQRIERIVDLPPAAQSAPKAFGPVGVMLGVALIGAVLLQSQARWTALEPLPAGFGPERLAATQWQPYVDDLVPRVATLFELLPPFAVAEELAAALPAPLPTAAPSNAIELPAPSMLAQAPQAANDVALQSFAPESVPAAPAAGDTNAVEPLLRPAPLYPPAARERGLEGWVNLTYRIDLDGRPFDVSIDAAQPDGVFERAALQALQQWRFDAAAASMDVQRVRFDFVLDRAAKPSGQGPAAESRQCLRSTGTRLCRPSRGAPLTVLLSGS